MKYLKTIAIFFFDILDKYIHQRRILNCLNKNELKINIFFDVGSHKGTYTDLFIKNFSIKKAYIFEPQDKIFKFIKKKYKKDKRIIVSNKAISNFNKVKKFLINKHDLTSSLTPLNESNIYLKFKSLLFGGNSMVVGSYNVKTIKLDDFITRNKVKSVDLLKIDTEGHEYQVLFGLGKQINKVKAILIEFHNDKIYKKYDSKKIHRYLVKNNFELKRKIKFPFTEWEDRIYFANRV